MFGWAVSIKININVGLESTWAFFRLRAVAQRQAEISTVPNPAGVLCCHLFSNQLMGRPCTITCSLRTFARCTEHQALRDERQKWDNHKSWGLQVSLFLGTLSVFRFPNPHTLSSLTVAGRSNTIDGYFGQFIQEEAQPPSPLCRAFLMDSEIKCTVKVIGQLDVLMGQKKKESRWWMSQERRPQRSLTACGQPRKTTAYSDLNSVT